MDSNVTAISLKNVDFSYPNRPFKVLDDFSLDVMQHEVIAVIGKSGCGKSTLIRLIAKLLLPTAGQIDLKNTSRVAVDFQDPRLLPWKNVADNIALAIRREAEPIQTEKIRTVLDMVGLKHAANYYPKELSGGMAQRAALARALVQEPDILLMDEPFGALDAITRAQIQMDFEKIQQHKKMTVIFITHEVNEAVRLADRVIVLAAGKVSKIINIDLPHPRSIAALSVAKYSSQVLTLLTQSW